MPVLQTWTSHSDGSDPNLRIYQFLSPIWGMTKAVCRCNLTCVSVFLESRGGGGDMSLEERLVNLEREIADLKASAWWGRLKSNFWRTFAVVMSLLFVALFAALYLHSAGFVSLASSSQASGVLPGQAKPSGDFRDLLTILVPMFAAGIAFVVSAAGMRRLQSYDDELARARQERRDDEKSMRKETADSAVALRTEVTTNAEKLRAEFKDERDAFKAQIKDQTDKVLNEKVVQLKVDLLDLKVDAEAVFKEATSKVLTDVQSTAKRLDDDFSFLKSREDLVDWGAKTLISVGALHNQVTQLLQSSISDDERKAMQLLDAALASPERMSGTPNDWFNLSAQLGRSDMELRAFEVCMTALARFADTNDAGYSPNQDLLAHAIQFASGLGKWGECNELLRQAEKIGRARWTWRLFVFVGDYFETRGNEQEYLTLNKEFSETLPFSEQPYSQLASYWYKRGQLHKSLEAIDLGMSKEGVRGERLLMRKSEILLDLSRYEEVVSVTSEALAATATDQPGSAQWAIMNNRAYAFDALLWQIIGAVGGKSPAQKLSTEDKKQATVLARSALASYGAASDLRGASLTTKAQAVTRMRLIRYACEVSGIDMAEMPEKASTQLSAAKRALKPAEARGLVAQLADQIKDMESDRWDAIKDALVEQLVSDFDESARALLCKQMLTAADDYPSAGDYLRLLSELVKPLVGE